MWVCPWVGYRSYRGGGVHSRRQSTAPADASSNPALVAEGLVKRYGRRRRAALAGFDVVINGGGLTALVGPNGAGKSTLIKAWVGLEAPSNGRVLVDGIDPWRNRPQALRRLGYVPQVPALYRALSIAEHLDYARSLRSSFDRRLAERRLAELGIPLDQAAGHLSGGQQAQAGLALALGTRAPILLLDEPLASLDPLARREFLHVLQDAVRAGDGSALLSSHVVTDIEQVCDRVVVLGAGQKLLDAGLDAAIADHRVSPARPQADGTLHRVATFTGAMREMLDLWRLPDPSAAHGITVPDLRSATLEEVVLGYLASSRETGVAQ